MADEGAREKMAKDLEALYQTAFAEQASYEQSLLDLASGGGASTQPT